MVDQRFRIVQFSQVSIEDSKTNLHKFDGNIEYKFGLKLSNDGFKNVRYAVYASNLLNENLGDDVVDP